MNIRSIFEDNYHIINKDKIIGYCRRAYDEKSEPSHINMYDPNWESNPASFLYLIYNSERFTNGNGDMYLLLDGDDIIATSGVCISHFDKNVALGGARTWLNKEMRGKFVVGRHLLPVQLKWAINNGLKTIALTFNDYNKRLIPYFKRSGFGIEKKRNPDSMFYNGQYHVDFPVMINYTKQWVIYHKIDESYTPDWESIRFQEYHDK